MNGGGVVQQGGLGYLDAQARRVGATVGDRRVEVVQESRLGQLHGTDVQPNGQRPAGPRRRPVGRLNAGLVQYPGADVENQTGLLGDLDEPGGRVEVAVGVAPAQEGLDGDDRAGGKVHLRLVPDDELVALECATKVALDGQSLGDGNAQLLVEHRHPVAPALLGDVHGGVGLAYQVVGGARLRGDRNPDTRRDEELGSLRRERRAQLLHDPRRRSHRFGRLIDLAHDDDELVTAGAGNEITCPHGRGDALGDGDQQLVPRGMAQGVVDVLEPVQIDHQHCSGLARPMTRVQSAGDLIGKLEAVGQAG